MKYNLHVSFRQLSLVVSVTDAFTGKIIQSNDLRVSIANEPDPLKKAEGYFVFINLSTKQVNLCIQEPRYTTQVIPLCLTELPIEEPLLHVRLSPGLHYPFPSDTTYLFGKAPIGSFIRLLYSQTACDTIFLKTDYTKNSPQIALYAPSPSSLCGNTFCIRNSDGIQEFFTITTLANAKEGLYILTAPLSNNYNCQNARIFSVFTTKSDDTGTYFLPFRLPNSEAETICQIFCSGKKQKKEELRLKAGERKEVNFSPKGGTP